MIAVVDYHKGNLKSVERGLIGVGADARITDDAQVIAAAEAIVLPGVGAFADAAASMQALGQMDVLRERILAGVPFLGICLGLHLMFDGGVEGASAEEPARGLGVLPGIVGALPKTDAQGVSYKIPHVGWNSIEYPAGAHVSPLFDGIAEGEFFYFTHSFIAPDCTEAIAYTTHSCTFPSAAQYGDVAFGVQFHPEKSSDAGAHVLANFVRLCDGFAS